MKKLYFLPLSVVFAFLLSACAEGEDIADRTLSNDAIINYEGNTEIEDAMENARGQSEQNENNQEDQKTTSEKDKDPSAKNANSANETLSLAPSVANKLAELDEVKSANVLVTKNMAFVGVKLKEEMGATDQLQNKIANVVRSAGNYRKVFVSFNPKFTEQLSYFSDRVNNNEPVESMLDEFTSTVDETFPNAGI